MKFGRRFFSPSFILYANPNSGPHTRLGITVTRKIGNAVTRNRFKRLVREAFRLHPEWFDRPVDLLVIVKRGRSPEGLGQVVRELQEVLGRCLAER